MNEYRVQRLKEDLTFAQRRNSRQRQQLANYKKVHEKDLKEKERLNNIVNKLEEVLNENVELTYVHYGRRQYNKTLTEGGLLFRDYIKSKLQELKGSDKE